MLWDSPPMMSTFRMLRFFLPHKSRTCSTKGAVVMKIHYVVAQYGIVAVGDDCLIVPFDGRDMEIMACNR